MYTIATITIKTIGSPRYVIALNIARITELSLAKASFTSGIKEIKPTTSELMDLINKIGIHFTFGAKQKK